VTIGIDFPIGPPPIHGNGAFFSWGTGDEDPSKAEVTWTGHQPVPGTSIPPPGTCRWAYRFAGVIADGTTPVTLTVFVWRPDPLGGGGMVHLPAATRTFTCTDHARIKKRYAGKKVIIINKGGTVIIKK